MRFLRALGLLLAAAAAVGGAIMLLRRHAGRSVAADPPELLEELGHRVTEAKAGTSIETFERLDLGAIAAAAGRAATGTEAVPAVEEQLGPVPELCRPLVEQLARARGRGAKTLAGRSLDDLAARAAELLAEQEGETDVAELLARELHSGQRVPRAVRSVAETAVALAASRPSTGLQTK
jgi:hypothetical protein